MINNDKNDSNEIIQFLLSCYMILENKILINTIQYSKSWQKWQYSCRIANKSVFTADYNKLNCRKIPFFPAYNNVVRTMIQGTFPNMMKCNSCYSSLEPSLLWVASKIIIIRLVHFCELCSQPSSRYLCSTKRLFQLFLATGDSILSCKL